MSVAEGPTRQGLPWTAEEDAALRAIFAETASIPAAVASHRRTRGAIRSRLVKLGLITSDGEPLVPPQPPSAPIAEIASAADGLARLTLSPRLAAALADLNVRTLDGFAALSSQRLLEIRGIRRRTIRELLWLQERLAADGASTASPPGDGLRDLLDRADASVRLRKALGACGITTVDEFLRLRPDRMLRVPGLGHRTALELGKILQEFAPPDTPDPPEAEAETEDEAGHRREPPPAAIARLDQLVRDLKAFREVLAEDSCDPARAHREVMKSFSRFDDATFQLAIGSARAAADDGEGEPLPDRLRNALADLVTVCVPDQKDRYVAIQVLGLDGDGQPLRLSDLAEVLGVSRERVRQRRVKAFSRIRGAARRRVASCQRLRTVMRAVSADADWTDPQQAAYHLVHLLADKVSVVEELTWMCCVAAGSDAKTAEMVESVREAAAAECRKVSSDPQWRLDIWKDAARNALFPSHSALFEGGPADLGGRKREPGENHDEGALLFRSGKLRREVACESGTEYKVMAWLERTPEVVWYQEQPLVVPYVLHGRNRRYYPDVAVLDRDGRCYVIEVKPIFGMYRETTLAKALACLEYAGGRGMGYLLVDQRGRTVADFAGAPYDSAVADEIDTLIDDLGQVRFPMVRTVFEDHLGKMSHAQFISMTLNRGWAVTEDPGVKVGRLPEGLSFAPLLGHLPRW